MEKETELLVALIHPGGNAGLSPAVTLRSSSVPRTRNGIVKEYLYGVEIWSVPSMALPFPVYHITIKKELRVSKAGGIKVTSKLLSRLVSSIIGGLNV
ncbi:unnamed protein product [Allacma fusca]|uniref:Uncharacterized protein n=1 Tax=Allacma fusca TaxID=39272 RepID=A0A8J2JNA2_9HEXA|nr:unnamed protein product [Allacma fusca]